MNDKVNQRMCIHCRKMYEKSALVRVARVDNQVFVDLSGKRGGRGAYLCSLECMERALKGKKLERALRAAVPEEVYLSLKEVLPNGK